MNKCAQHHSDSITLTLMQWGQFIDHDLVLTPETPGVNGCCEDFRTVTTSSPDCVPIDVRGDEFYGSVGSTVNCLSFVRSQRATCIDPNNPNRETINVLTAYLDGSMIYGSTDTVATSLRSFSGGLLKFGPGSENLSCVQSTQDSCPRSFLPTRPGTSGNPEFFAVEEQPSLTSLHTCFLRFHNYIASLVNCNGDELKYQAARKIVGAIVQVITYNEFLPLVLGQNVMNDDFSYGRALSLDRSYFYNKSICTTAPNVFSTACFRFGHSLLPDKFNLPNGRVIKLAESFNNHDITIKDTSFPSHFLGGITLQTSMPMDQHITEAVQSFLFAQGPSFGFGSDLPARNIQRGRDHGIPGYVTWHNACVNSPYDIITSFDDLIGIMPDCVIAAFKKLYK
ncbi:Myeloperoxidase [Armadillidium nasatum]|uniref:Myeloperoxidase n=1 Tax=Armadillidium nasatum TaxID=96803 RepID=A0A5N5TA69_9CRUS|nr:Myeloperoxidase [Armadillidium nasatum]